MRKQLNYSPWLVLILLGLATPALGQIYKWVDENGVIQYSSKPPANQEAQTVELKKDKPASKQKTATQKPSNNSTQPTTTSSAEDRAERARKVIEEALKKRDQFLANSKKQPKKIFKKNFDGKNLEYTDFSKRSITRTTFDKSQLKGATFKDAETLELLSFKDADLTDVDFSNAFINQVDFTGANLTNANFDDSSCINCKFNNANLSNATFRQTTLYKTSFDSAELNNAEFTFVTWGEVDLSGARNVNHEQLYQEVKKNPNGVGNIIYDYNGCAIGVAKAICRGIDLSGHKFYAKQVTESDFTKSNLSNADFTLTRVLNSDFTGANLTGAIFGKHVWQTNFAEANLTNANFKLSSLTEDNVNFTGANLKGLLYIKASVNPAVFAKARLTGCEDCQAKLKANTIDFNALRKFIAEYESPSSAGYTNKQAYAKLASQRDYISMVSGQAVLSGEQYADLFLLMLKSDEPLLVYDSMKLIKKMAYTGGPGNICTRPKVIVAMLPLIDLSSEEMDSRVKRKQAGKSPSEYIRYNVINCLSTNIPKFKRVSQTFRSTYQTEPLDDIKLRLMKGYHDDPKQLEAILKAELATKHSKVAKQAAILLQEAHIPSPNLVAALLNFLETERYADSMFYKLLEKFNPNGELDIARFESVKAARKSQKWNTTPIDMLIRHYRRQAKKAGA